MELKKKYKSLPTLFYSFPNFLSFLEQGHILHYENDIYDSIEVNDNYCKITTYSYGRFEKVNNHQHKYIPDKIVSVKKYIMVVNIIHSNI